MEQIIYKTMDRIGTKWLIPLSLISFTYLSMGIFSCQLGLYGDQWKHVYQPSSIPINGLVDGYIQKVFIQVIGANVVVVHLINGILFILSAYLLFQWLKQLNFGLKFSLATSLLFIVSPAFRQPGAGFELSSILLGLIFSFLSALFSGKTLLIRRDNRFLIGSTVLFSITALLANPYVVCLQTFVFFPALIVVKKTGFINKRWFYLGAVVNAIVAIVITITNQEIVSVNKIGTLKEISRDLISAFVLSWRQIIVMPESGTRTILYLIFVAIGIVILFGFFSYLSKIETANEVMNNSEIRQQTLIFLISISAGFVFLLFLNLGGMPIGLSYPDDLGMVVLGVIASIMLVSLVQVLFLPQYQTIVLAITIVLCAGSRYLSADGFVQETRKLNDIVAQLRLRGDYFEQGTNILVEQLPLNFTTRGSFEAIIKSNFSRDTNDLNIVPAESEIVREFLENASADSTKIDIDGDSYILDKKSLISIWVPQKGCLQIIEPEWEMGTLPDGLSASKPYSRRSLLVKSTNMSDVKQLAGIRTTIIDSWCFLYQIANVAFSEGDWNTVIDVYDEARLSNTEPERYQEYFQLLVALINAEKYEEAEELSVKLMNSPTSKKSICSQWNMMTAGEEQKKEVVQKVKDSMKSIHCQ